MAKRVFKTTKKVSGGDCTYRAWEKWKEGDILVGKYIGTGPTDKYGKDTFQFEVEELFFNDKKAQKELKDKVLTLNFTGGFAKSMKSVDEGDMVQLTYNGQNEIQKGEWKGEMAHAIEVEVGEMDDDGEGRAEEEEQEEEEENDL